MSFLGQCTLIGFRVAEEVEEITSLLLCVLDHLRRVVDHVFIRAALARLVYLVRPRIHCEHFINAPLCHSSDKLPIRDAKDEGHLLPQDATRIAKDVFESKEDHRLALSCLIQPELVKTHPGVNRTLDKELPKWKDVLAQQAWDVCLCMRAAKAVEKCEGAISSGFRVHTRA